MVYKAPAALDYAAMTKAKSGSQDTTVSVSRVAAAHAKERANVEGVTIRDWVSRAIEEAYRRPPPKLFWVSQEVAPKVEKLLREEGEGFHSRRSAH